jgi:dihydrofolate reductase
MSHVRVHCFTLSLDGYGAGVGQTLEAPMGVNGQRLHPWLFATAYGHRMMGREGGTTGVDDAWLRRGDEGIGAHVMGRNMFGPVRGPWPDESWRGWWGEEPPYGHDVFVLTHHPRETLAVGRTTFHFVTEGPDVAIARAREAAAGADVRVGGGVSTVRDLLSRGVVDELHVALSPVLLGAGERLWDGVAPFPEGYDLVEREQGEGATHLRWVRAS